MSESVKLPHVVPDPLVPEGVVLLLDDERGVRRVVEIVKENTALRARVRELEGEVQRLCLSLTHEGPDLTKRVLDRAIAARGKPLLPAPAPGRDTAGPGTTTGGTDAA